MQTVPFQVFAWMAAFLFAIEAILGKFISNHKIKNPWLFNIVWIFFAFLVNSAVCLYFGAHWPKFWANIIWAAVFYSLGMAIYVFANYRLDVSVLTPLYNFKVLFMVIFGTLFLGERLTSFQLVIILIMLLGGILVTFDETFSFKHFLNRGMFLALVEVLVLALMAMFLKKAAAQTDFWTLNFWYCLLGSVATIFTWKWFKADIKTLDKVSVSGLFFMALAGSAGNLAAAKAYSSNISISGAITAVPVSMVLVIIFSFFFPKLLEHHSRKVYAVRILAAAVLFWCGIKLS